MIEAKLLRTCGKCQVILSKENTGKLQCLQPNCNDCTNKYEAECKHQWMNDTSVKRQTCVLCGYLRGTVK